MQIYFIYFQLLLPSGRAIYNFLLRGQMKGPGQRLSSDMSSQRGLHKQIHRYTCTHICTYPHTYTQKCIRAFAHTHILTCTHIHRNIYICTHTCTHTFTYTYTHTLREGPIIQFYKRGHIPPKVPLEINGPTLLHISQFQITRPEQDPLLSNLNYFCSLHPSQQTCVFSPQTECPHSLRYPGNNGYVKRSCLTQ